MITSAIFFLEKLGVVNATSGAILAGDVSPVQEDPTFFQKMLGLGKILWGAIALIIVLIFFLIVIMVRKPKGPSST